MKKGFTLIELLAVLTIIALIGTIAVVSMTDVFDNASSGINSVQLKAIEDASRQWVIENGGILNKDKSNYLELETLRDEGILENSDITDASTGEIWDGCIKITYDYSYNQFLYEYIEICTN
ncbi:MAG: type II secretion system protein [Mycoplasmatota bacterium]